jgi:phosphate transport system substrate-binding protein
MPAHRIFLLFLLSFLAASASATEIRLNGATTCINSVINPHRAAVEKATGFELKIVGNATGKGLVDLSEGRCDASLTSEPLDIAIEAAAVAGGKLNAGDYRLHEVKTENIVFVVHPSNPVNELTHDQIRKIHIGEITNWKQVGGPDLAIVVFTDAVTGGTRAMVKRVVMNGEPYSTTCRALDTVRLVAYYVAELKSGFGAVGRSFADPKKVKILETEKVVRPLGFITKGEPAVPIRQVIDAFRAEAAGNRSNPPGTAENEAR